MQNVSCFRGVLSRGASPQVLRGQADDLGDLSASSVAAGSEVESGAGLRGPAIVARDNLVTVCGLDVLVESVGFLHVYETGDRGVEQAPARGHYHNFRELPPGYQAT